MRRGLGFHARRSPGGFNPLFLFAGGIDGAWYDPSDATTLFSDRAGTTPCATPGAGAVVPVGAMLDKRASGYSVFFDGTGDYLTAPDSATLRMGAGDFTVEFWINFASISGYQTPFDKGVVGAGALLIQTGFGNGRMMIYDSGVAVITETGTGATGTWIHYAIVRNAGTLKLYRNGIETGSVANTTDFNNTSALGIGAYGTAGAGQYAVNGYISNLRVVKGTAVYTGNFTPPTGPLSPITGTSLLTCGTSWSGNPAITKNGDARVDGLNPFQASPVGNHAIAANDTTARPELSARVNLLTYSEQFENAAWDKLNGVTISQNSAIAPDGTTTADKLIAPNSTGTGRVLRQALASGVNGVSYVSSFYAKFVSGEFSWVRALGTDAGVVWFDIQNGVRGTVTGANTTGTITSVGNGWYRCVITSTANSTNIYSYLNPVDADGSTTTTGDGSKGVLIWGADLRPTNIGSQIPAYQRVADQYTYDSTGFPRYLKCNGTSSAMSTPANVNLSGTDKVTVFAGVRKNSDAGAAGVLTEFTADINVNNGSFIVTAPSGAGGVNYLFGSNGTIRRDATGTATFAAPVSSVVSGIGDISGDIATLRVNGVQNATNTANQGTGNYANAQLFIGARNLSTLFLTGDIYSLIVVGSAVSAGNITATETWVNGKTGGVY